MLVNLLSFLLIFILCVVGCLIYVKVALKNRIISSPNFRSLHLNNALTGGGVVFSLVFVSTVSYLWLTNDLSDDIFLVLGVGGFFASLVGFCDDLINIGAFKKLVLHSLLSVWTIYWLDINLFSNIDWFLQSFSIALSVLFLVWVINAYNFIDGIDGLAISGVIFISGGLILIMMLSNNYSELTILYFSLLACSIGFIIFNWPPARIFMGDSGSIFLGYIIGALILLTIKRGEVTAWAWIVIFGYFISDTTVTQIMRLILVKKWYEAHRSHAYQNLARLSGSHLKVTTGIALYHIIWLLPLLLWTIKQPDSSIFAAILAVLPAALISVKYGPLTSSS
ncbi:glycosyltransferase family 4 protein [Candidatus Pseudothioglobus singularis]|nr:glycosyltransferase family 4 protein [Candidatus Pseudothioglobus singularis]